VARGMAVLTRSAEAVGAKRIIQNITRIFADVTTLARPLMAHKAHLPLI